ncbi:hypothetical protein E1301_Tti001427 [Triplophysa tibetana]|uniref:Uncharacterized protein n=1 Tax=Triplophysa tibetana TaxID=1572043 RepID=A0A5A9PAC9_9TELE|nr:hypothetical protein E1301_Tti001427 [Triplophysa tibetana]
MRRKHYQSVPCKAFVLFVCGYGIGPIRNANKEEGGFGRTLWFRHVCAFGDRQTCSTHLSTVLHPSHMGTSEQWAAKLQPFVFYPWAWNHIKAKQHASVGGKGFQQQGQGSSAEQRKASKEREGERGGVEERELM